MRVASCTAGRMASLRVPSRRGSDNLLNLTCGPAVLLQLPGAREALPGRKALQLPSFATAGTAILVVGSKPPLTNFPVGRCRALLGMTDP